MRITYTNQKRARAYLESSDPLLSDACTFDAAHTSNLIDVVRGVNLMESALSPYPLRCSA